MATAFSSPRIFYSCFPGHSLSSAAGPLQDAAGVKRHRTLFPARLRVSTAGRALKAAPAEDPRQRAERTSDFSDFRVQFVVRESCTGNSPVGTTAEAPNPADALVLMFRVREDTPVRSILSFAKATQGFGNSEFRGKIIRPDVFHVCESKAVALDEPWVLLAEEALGLRNPNIMVQADSKEDAEKMRSALQPIIEKLHAFTVEQVNQRGQLD